MPIKKLPNFLINQIKAGEVVESPAYLIKELVENSLDAGATAIEVSFSEGGMKQIRVIDNGSGIERSDLPLVFARHATSKLTQFDQLYSLDSFGFRGEALASIGSVSVTKIRSKTQAGESLELNCQYGELGEVSSSPSIVSHRMRTLDHGTEILVTDLFAKTPVRLKFVKGQKTETQKILKVLHSFALENPSVEFFIQQDQESPLKFEPVSSTIERWHQLMPHKSNQRSNEKSNRSIKTEVVIDRTYQGISLKGILSKGSNSRNLKRFLFVNHRSVENQKLHQAVLTAVKKIFGDTLGLQFCLSLETSKDKVDVNVHPNKIQVRLIEQEAVYALLFAAVGKALESEKVSSDLESKGAESKYISTESNFSSASQVFSRDNPNWQSSNPQDQRYILGNSEAKQTGFYQHFHWIRGQHQDIQAFNLPEVWGQVFLAKDFLKSSESIPLFIATPLSPISKDWIRFFMDRGFDFESTHSGTLKLMAIPFPLCSFKFESFFRRFSNSGFSSIDSDLEQGDRTPEGNLSPEQYETKLTKLLVEFFKSIPDWEGYQQDPSLLIQEFSISPKFEFKLEETNAMTTNGPGTPKHSTDNKMTYEQESHRHFGSNGDSEDSLFN